MIKFKEPTFREPTFNAPRSNEPSFNNPTFTDPSFNPPRSSEPQFYAPRFEEPIFDDFTSSGDYDDYSPQPQQEQQSDRPSFLDEVDFEVEDNFDNPFLQDEDAEDASLVEEFTKAIGPEALEEQAEIKPPVAEKLPEYFDFDSAIKDLAFELEFPVESAELKESEEIRGWLDWVGEKLKLTGEFVESVREPAGEILEDSRTQISKGLALAGVNTLETLYEVFLPKSTQKIADEISPEFGKIVSEKGLAPLIPYMAQATNIYDSITGAGQTTIDSAQKALREIKAETVTGEVLGGVAQFVGAFVGAGKFTAGIKKLASAPALLQGMTRGAFADALGFDEMDRNLSATLNDIPALKKYVPDWLAVDGDDSTLEAKTKHVVEGALLGGFLEVALKGGKALSQALRGSIDDTLDSTASGVIKALKETGDVSDDLLTHPDVTRPFTTSMANQHPEQFNNWVLKHGFGLDDAQIKSNDLLDTLRKLGGKQFTADLDQNIDAFYKGGTDIQLLKNKRFAIYLSESLSNSKKYAEDASFKFLKEAADTPDRFITRKNLLELYDSVSGRKVVDEFIQGVKITKQLAPMGYKMNGTVRTMGDVIQDVTTEISPKLKTPFLKQLTKGLPKETQEKLLKTDPNLWDKAVFAKNVTRDVLLNIRQFNLLSGLTTQVKNYASIAAITTNQVMETSLARLNTKVFGIKGGVEAGEITAEIAGMIQGLKHGIDDAVDAFKTGQTKFGQHKLDIDPIMTATKLGLSEESFIGKGITMLGKGTALTGKALMFGDEYGKIVNHTGSIYKVATRIAQQEGLVGEAITRRVQDLILNPTEEMLERSLLQATTNTLTNKLGPFASKIEAIRDGVPSTKFLLPFYKTLANNTKYGLERFPLTGVFMPSLRDGIRKGGVDKAYAIAKLETGAIYGGLFAWLFGQQVLTQKSPSNKGERETLEALGWLEYSVKVGNKFYQIPQDTPGGQLMRMWSDITQAVDFIRDDPDEAVTVEALFNHGFMATAEMLTDTNWSQDINRTMSAITSGSEGQVKAFLTNLATSIVVPNIMRQGAANIDDAKREATGYVDKIIQRIPGLAEGLPKHRDTFGRVSDPTVVGVLGMVNPFKVKEGKGDGFEDHFFEQGFSLPRPDKTMTFDTVSIDLRDNMEIYSRVLELSGTLKNPIYGNKTMIEYFNDLIHGSSEKSKFYQKMSDGPGGGKEDMIRSAMNSYRDIAKKIVLEENPGFAESIKNEKQSAFDSTLKDKALKERIVNPEKVTIKKLERETLKPERAIQIIKERVLPVQDEIDAFEEQKDAPNKILKEIETQKKKISQEIDRIQLNVALPIQKQINQITKQLKGPKQEIRELEKVMAEPVAKIKKLQADIKSLKDNRVAGRGFDIRGMEDEIAELRGKISEPLNKRRELQQQVREGNAVKADLRDNLGPSDEAIYNMRLQSQRLDGLKLKPQEMIDNLSKRQTPLREKIEELERQIDVIKRNNLRGTTQQINKNKYEQQLKEAELQEQLEQLIGE